MKTAAKSKKAAREFKERRGLVWLWFGVLAAPFAFLMHLEINYALVAQVCESGQRIVLHLVTLLFLLLAASGAFVAWRNWQETGRRLPGEAGSVLERSRLMAAVGFLMSALFILALIAQWIPQFFLDPCMR